MLFPAGLVTVIVMSYSVPLFSPVIVKLFRLGTTTEPLVSLLLVCRTALALEPPPPPATTQDTTEPVADGDLVHERVIESTVVSTSSVLTVGTSGRGT